MNLTVESLKELWTQEFLLIRKETRLLDLNKRFDEIEKSQNFISKQYDTVISTIKNLKEHNEGVKSQVQEIEEDINKLRNDG